MTESQNLITAQISFLDNQMKVIHIPTDFYSVFLQPTLRLLVGEDHDEDAAKISWTNRHEFLNITISPVECSVICSKQLAERFFVPLLDLCGSDRGLSAISQAVEISMEDYCVMQVDGQGLEAGQRVLELTSPLAMAGISIFFITTYFCDYILLPHRSRHKVKKALHEQGFVFSPSADAFVSQLSPTSPITISHSNSQPLSSNPFDRGVPITPPARDLAELQVRTFTKLKRKQIRPTFDSTLQLLNCAGNSAQTAEDMDRLKNDLIQVLLSTSPVTLKAGTSKTQKNGEQGRGLGLSELITGPIDITPDFSTRFLSITITAQEPISVLLEHRLIGRLGSSLLGSKDIEDALIPITLDLKELPMEATGIVCGVASQLAQGTANIHQELAVSPKTNGEDIESTGSIEIAFLSTAKAGTVLVKASQLERALEALEYGMCEIAERGK